jgi:hypothetical protein
MKKAISILLVISFVLMATVMSASATVNTQVQTTNSTVITAQGNFIAPSQNGAIAIAGSLGISPLGLNAAGNSQSQSNSNLVLVSNINNQRLRTSGLFNF